MGLAGHRSLAIPNRPLKVPPFQQTTGHQNNASLGLADNKLTTNVHITSLNRIES